MYELQLLTKDGEVVFTKTIYTTANIDVLQLLQLHSVTFFQ